MRLMLNVTALAVAAVLSSIAACGDSSPTEPDTAFNPPGTYQMVLSGVGWSAAGGASITPRAAGGQFTADFKIRLHNAKPNTLYTVQRAAEVGRVLTNDGVCQRGMGVSPWSSTDPPAAAFVSFPQADGTTPVTFMTSATGEGSLDYTFTTAAIVTGTRFDVMLRIVNDVLLPTSVVLGACVTVLAL